MASHVVRCQITTNSGAFTLKSLNKHNACSVDVFPVPLDESVRNIRPLIDDMKDTIALTSSDPKIIEPPVLLLNPFS